MGEAQNREKCRFRVSDFHTFIVKHHVHGMDNDPKSLLYILLECPRYSISRTRLNTDFEPQLRRHGARFMGCANLDVLRFLTEKNKDFDANRAPKLSE